MVDKRSVERIVRRYLRETEGRGSHDVYQEVADLDPSATPAEVARLVDRVLVRVLAAEDREEARQTVPNPLGEGLGDRRLRALATLTKARRRPDGADG